MRTLDDEVLIADIAIGGLRLLVGLRHQPIPNSGITLSSSLMSRYLPLKTYSGSLRPDLDHHVDRFERHLGSGRVIFGLEQLEVAAQAARADAEQQSSFAHVVELRNFARHAGKDGVEAD